MQKLFPVHLTTYLMSPDMIQDSDPGLLRLIIRRLQRSTFMSGQAMHKLSKTTRVATMIIRRFWARALYTIYFRLGTCINHPLHQAFIQQQSAYSKLIGYTTPCKLGVMLISKEATKSWILYQVALPPNLQTIFVATLETTKENVLGEKLIKVVDIEEAKSN